MLLRCLGHTLKGELEKDKDHDECVKNECVEPTTEASGSSKSRLARGIFRFGLKNSASSGSSSRKSRASWNGVALSSWSMIASSSWIGSSSLLFVMISSGKLSFKCWSRSSKNELSSVSSRSEGVFGLLGAALLSLVEGSAFASETLFGTTARGRCQIRRINTSLLWEHRSVNDGWRTTNLLFVRKKMPAGEGEQATGYDTE